MDYQIFLRVEAAVTVQQPRKRETFDASTQCFFCGADNSEQGRGYGGERGCDSCGKGGQGEPDEPVMAYHGKQLVYSKQAMADAAQAKGEAGQ